MTDTKDNVRSDEYAYTCDKHMDRDGDRLPAVEGFDFEEEREEATMTRKLGFSELADAVLAAIGPEEVKEGDPTCRAVVASDGNGNGCVLFYVGRYLSSEIEESKFTALADLGFDDAEAGLSVWEGMGRWIPGGYEHPAEGEVELEGVFRPLTASEWSAVRQGVCPWPPAKGDLVWTEPRPRRVGNLWLSERDVDTLMMSRRRRVIDGKMLATRFQKIDAKARTLLPFWRSLALEARQSEYYERGREGGIKFGKWLAENAASRKGAS